MICQSNPVRRWMASDVECLPHRQQTHAPSSLNPRWLDGSSQKTHCVLTHPSETFLPSVQ